MTRWTLFLLQNIIHIQKCKWNHIGYHCMGSENKWGDTTFKFFTNMRIEHPCRCPEWHRIGTYICAKFGYWFATAKNRWSDTEVAKNRWSDTEVAKNRWSDTEVAKNRWSDTEVAKNRWSDTEVAENRWSDTEVELLKIFLNQFTNDPFFI